MSKATGYCPNCKNEVEFVVEGSFLHCPDCGQKFQQSRTSAQIENRTEGTSLKDDLLAALRVLVIFLLVLAGIFFVLLAFLYAAC